MCEINMDELRLDERITGVDKRLDMSIISLEKRLEGIIQALEAKLTLSINALEKELRTALISTEKAIGKAETSIEKRFESVNEFRSMVNDQVMQNMSKAEAEPRFAGLLDRISKLETFQYTILGERTKAESIGAKSMWIVGTVITIVIALATILVSILIKK